MSMLLIDDGNDDNDDDDDDGGDGETGCQASCSPDAALRETIDYQQSNIDSMQEQITRMRDLVRSMTSGTGRAAAAEADAATAK